MSSIKIEEEDPLDIEEGLASSPSHGATPERDAADVAAELRLHLTASSTHTLAYSPSAAASLRLNDTSTSSINLNQDDASASEPNSVSSARIDNTTGADASTAGSTASNPKDATLESSSGSQSSLSQEELIVEVDDSGPPLLKRKSSRIDLMEEENDVPHDPPADIAAMVPESLGVEATDSDSSNKQTVAASSARFEYVDDDGGAPAPFDSTEFDTSTDSSKNKTAGGLSTKIEYINDDDNDALTPSFEHYNNKMARNSVTTNIMEEEVVGGDEESQQRPLSINSTHNVRTDDDTENPSSPNDDDTENQQQQADATVWPALLGHDQSAHVIPHAFLVDPRDDVVIIATPAVPWYKQSRAKCLLGIGSIVLLGFAVTLGLSLSRDTTVSGMVTLASAFPSVSISPTMKPTTNVPSAMPTPEPSVSINPSMLPSFKPSPMPSSSPSVCLNKIISNMQKINLPLDNPTGLQVADDGRAMVVVAQEKCGGPIHVAFHTMTNDGLWQRVDLFVEDDLGVYYEDYCYEEYSVSMSDTTVFVGFYQANDRVGTVAVYEQDNFGNWHKMDDPFSIHNGSAIKSFGYHVGIDGDMACVKDSGGVVLFRREEISKKWVQFDMIDGGYWCSISGDTFVVRGYSYDSELDLQTHSILLYEYRHDLDEVVPIQDPIITGPFPTMDLSNDHLVYWDTDEQDAFIYHRDETNQTFVFRQELNMTGLFNNVRLALDDDILVLSGDDKTYIFSEQDGLWEEAITLDQSYRRYALSGRTLLATTYTEVYSFNIEDCVQAMPTGTPSLSMSPSNLLSSPPSMSPSSSLAPSSSFAPTVLFCIEITVAYDDYPSETRWDLYRKDGRISYGLVKRHYAASGDTSHVESLCLPEGEYRYMIFDAGNNGICCESGEGGYNITLNGALIDEGGKFGLQDTAYFSLPFIPVLASLFHV